MVVISLQKLCSDSLGRIGWLMLVTVYCVCWSCVGQGTGKGISDVFPQESIADLLSDDRRGGSSLRRICSRQPIGCGELVGWTMETMGKML